MTHTSGIVDSGSSIVVIHHDLTTGALNMSISGYKELLVWKKGMEIVELTYKITKDFPKSEKFSLASQMQRAAISIPCNIAEGFARGHRKEFQRFCQIALDSCSELETQIAIAYRQSYIKEMELASAEALLDHESRMLMKLIIRLNDKS
jgi:four helix bundle protein